MKRIFMMVNQPCYGESGGGHGIEYRLYRTNEKEHILDNIYFVFSDRVIKNGEEIGCLAKKKNIIEQSKFKIISNKLKPGFLRALKIQNDYNKICKYISELNRKYIFSDEDIYIFHDVKMAYAFTKCFTYKKCALVFHMQGSVYHEWKSFSGISSSSVQYVLNKVFIDAVKKMRYLCFPSKGAKESLIDSAPELNKNISKAIIKYIYNGVDCPDISSIKLPKEVKISEEDDDRLIFTTVAALNSAKAVERIPQFLGQLKKHGNKIVWILVGNGIMAPLVEKEIVKNGIEKNTIWMKDFVPHDQVLKILSRSDFYILFHKQSIFDLSTLEAMHYGCIPVLTPVGGNNEMIIRENGFFVNNFGDVRELEAAIQNGVLDTMKQKNIELQEQMFGEEAMLKRYSDLCFELEK